MFLRYAVLLSFIAVAARSDEAEFRLRSNIGRDNRVYYEIAEVVRLSDDQESNSLLVRDSATGDQYILRRQRDFKEQSETWEISDVSGKSFLRTSTHFPFTSRTRTDTLREAREHPQLIDVPTVLNIESNGGSWSGMNTDWDEWFELRRLRHEIRQVTSFYLIEGVERMRDGVFAQPAARIFYALVAKFVLYDTAAERETRFTANRAMPNCEFDESFGMPCTAAQKKRVAKAVESGDIPQRY